MLLNERCAPRSPARDGVGTLFVASGDDAEFHLHLVGYRLGVRPGAFPDLELQSLEGESPFVSHGVAGTLDAERSDHVLADAFDGKFPPGFVAIRTCLRDCAR